MSYEHTLKSFDCQSVSFFIISSFVKSQVLACKSNSATFLFDLELLTMD
ncbi:MAG: hypothetical protein JWQ57_739 [Mucilaginibacter sp.]|nr:hypothetical protein [Mucilaginibacter sp.]